MSVRIIDKSINHLMQNLDGTPVKAPFYPKITYMCTSIDDISTLPREGIEGTVTDSVDSGINSPCSVGSEALVKTGDVYLLWPDNTWNVF